MSLLSSLLLLLAGAAAGDHPAALVGDYNGSQMEMAAGLELSADGRFRYGLSYGAIDEQAAGRWHAEGSKVVLDSDPVKAPVFSLLEQEAAPAHILRISLDVPKGMDPQYFNAEVLLSDGTEIDRQLTDEGLSLPLSDGQHVVGVRIILTVFDLRSDVIAVDAAKGLGLRFRFEPNDLGHVDFRGTVMDEEKGELTLNRYDRLVRFRRNQH